MHEIMNWLREPQARLVLVLGNFGTGKTFLLHELARRIPSEIPYLVPVLIELRTLEKARTFDQLIAQHLNRTTEDSYTSSLAVESFPFGLSVAQRSRRLPDPLVACSSTSPLARLRSERTAGVFSRSFILYQCPVV